MNEISTLLALPESKTLEFKQDLSSLQPILKTIVAFANTAGGILIIGVKPDRKIVGLPDVLKAEEKLANAIADSIAPAILPDIEVATINKKNILVVKVSHWRGPFYLEKLGMPSGVYIRLGSTSRPAGPEIVAELKRVLVNQSYDQQAVSSLTIDALDLQMIRKTFRSIRKEINIKKLQSLSLLVADNHGLVPSIGGIILFGKQEIREQYFPDARVRCARFQGNSKSTIIDQYEVEGTILNALEKVPKFISRNTRLAAVIEDIRRKDVPEYPPVAVREILINAVVHADYSIMGSTVQIAIFDDRLEIQNPGMLPFGYTLDDLKSGVSRVRNRVIAKVFHELKFTEEWGSGYKRVKDACQEGNYLQPEWVEQGASMRVTFFSQQSPQHSTKRQRAPISVELSIRQQAIITLIDQEGTLPFREIYKHFSHEVSERTLHYELAQLQKKKLLISSGRGPSIVWKKS